MTAVQIDHSLARPVDMQGDTRYLPPKNPFESGTQRSGTEPYFDPNSDHMAQIDPLAPHYDLSGDFLRLVNPLKPGPKISGLG